MLQRKLEKVVTTLNSWKYHRLTLIGKIAVLNPSACLYPITPVYKCECDQRSKQTFLLLSLERKGRQNQAKCYHQCLSQRGA